MRPICFPCKLEMTCEKNEVMVKDKAVGQFPSTYWYGDLYECPGCGARIVTGLGRAMEAEKAEKMADAKTAMEFTH